MLSRGKEGQKGRRGEEKRKKKKKEKKSKNFDKKLAIKNVLVIKEKKKIEIYI